MTAGKIPAPGGSRNHQEIRAGESPKGIAKRFPRQRISQENRASDSPISEGNREAITPLLL
jgi:hypothetical protein